MLLLGDIDLSVGSTIALIGTFAALGASWGIPFVLLVPNSFFRLSAAEGQKDFDLYELVPSTTSAVFVTDDVLEFVAVSYTHLDVYKRQIIYLWKLMWIESV